ncbi:ATP-binding protein [Candidatus Woesearchaeota archaeon]|nr:ATP-binding protein [Candidatus Woesearchaeota archaeon]
MKTVAITGGKGGTGKSTVATSLAYELAKDHEVLLVDADVDCPNDHILLGINRKIYEPVYQRVPKWDLDKCKKCGQCAKVCRLNAIIALKGINPTLSGLCNGCGACELKCPTDAISWQRKKIGQIFSGNKYNIDLLSGELLPNEPISESIVNALKDIIIQKRDDYDYIIIDTAAGTHCPVIAALEICDLAFAVTEPTPLGTHDLELILRLLKMISVKPFVIINRSDIGNKDPITALAKKYLASIVCEIPYSKDIILSYAHSEPIEGDFVKILRREIENL